MDINIFNNLLIFVGVNIFESVGVDKIIIIGMMYKIFVGGDSVLNVLGELYEIVEGN